MKLKTLFAATMLSFSPLFWGIYGGEVFAQKEISYTQDDRDRLLRMEEQIKALEQKIDIRFEAMQKEMNTRFEAMNTRFEAIQKQIDVLTTLIYFILGGVFGLIGLIFWDRRSYIKPVKEDIRELQNALNALKDYSKKQPELAEILRQHRLL